MTYFLQSLSRLEAELTSFRRNDPDRFQAATLVEIAELSRQHQVTNVLLSINNDIAFQSSTLMQGILASVMYLKQADERERASKEMLYQMIKLLKADDKGILDEVEMAFRSRLFLHLIKECKLSTADLSHLKEKQLFDKLVSRANMNLKSPAYKELEDFEFVYGMFNAAQSHDPTASVKLPKAPTPPKLLLPEKPTFHVPKREVAETFDKELERKRSDDGCALAGCGTISVLLLLAGIGNVLQQLSGSEDGSDRSGPGVGMIVFGGACLALVSYMFRHSRQTKEDPKVSAEQKRDYEKRKAAEEAKIAKLQKTHERDMQKYEEAVKKAKQDAIPATEAFERAKSAYDLEKRKCKQELRQLRSDHSMLLNELSGKLCTFLDTHAGLQEFLPKVTSQGNSVATIQDLERANALRVPAPVELPVANVWPAMVSRKKDPPASFIKGVMKSIGSAVVNVFRHKCPKCKQQEYNRKEVDEWYRDEVGRAFRGPDGRLTRSGLGKGKIEVQAMLTAHVIVSDLTCLKCGHVWRFTNTTHELKDERFSALVAHMYRH